MIEAQHLHLAIGVVLCHRHPQHVLREAEETAAAEAVPQRKVHCKGDPWRIFAAVDTTGQAAHHGAERDGQERISDSDDKKREDANDDVELELDRG